ncbi:MAG: RAMP superfamily CRISPR-associated protein [Nostoc sp.]
MTNAGERQQPIPTNPWLNHPLNRNPNPVEEASFVEYLRWMRILKEKPNNTSERGKKLATQIDLVNNGEVIQLLDNLQEISNYDSRLKTLTDRIWRLATVSFEATTSWRVRVGGMRGPASMLLPAFDALGMPYIPSSTLKGVAREMARRDRHVTDDEIREIFGDIEPTACMGKVIFLFRRRLNSFYTNLSTLTQVSCNYQQPRKATKNGDWAEAVDRNCRIICVQGDFSNDKPPALALLHQQASIGSGYDSELCGSIQVRSPIWIARVGDRFDIATIFGVDNPRRQAYFNSLIQRKYPISDYREIWHSS